MAKAEPNIPPNPNYHDENISAVLRHALWLAECAGAETDAVLREDLIQQCMLAWRAAQRIKCWPDMAGRA